MVTATPCKRVCSTYQDVQPSNERSRPDRRFIAQRIKQTPDLTLHRPKAELASLGMKVSHDTVWRSVWRGGLRLKKYQPPRRGRTDFVQRSRWRPFYLAS